MHSQVIGLRTASVVFGLVGFAQLLRLLVRPDIVVAGHYVPLWPGAIALVVLAGLSIWLYRLSTFHTS